MQPQYFSVVMIFFCFFFFTINFLRYRVMMVLFFNFVVVMVGGDGSTVSVVAVEVVECSGKETTHRTDEKNKCTA